MPIRNLNIRGKEYPVYRSEKEDKKFKIYKDDKPIHFGAKGYSIAPGTSKGDNYCARSYGIPHSDPFSPNALSRQMWNCKGKRSQR